MRTDGDGVPRGVGSAGPRPARGGGDRAESWGAVALCPSCGRSILSTSTDLSAAELLARHRRDRGCPAEIDLDAEAAEAVSEPRS